MEFERALFRIHQKCLYSSLLRQGRLLLEKWLPWACAGLVLSLAVLHSEYVGQARCLPIAFKRHGLWNATTDRPELPDDVVLFLTVIEGGDLETGLRLRMDEAGASKAAAPWTPAAQTAGVRVGTGFKVSSENASLLASAPASPSGAAASAAASAAPAAVGEEGWSGDFLPDPSSVIASFKFALDREVITLKPSIVEKHHFQVRNVSVSERCLVPSWTVGEAFAIFGGLDNIVINELAYSLRSRGFLTRVNGQVDIESWAWSAESVEFASPAEGRSLLAALSRKVGLLVKATITYSLISSLSGFFIRVAVNGSAVLMFPIAMALQDASGGAGASRISLGVLSRSFPWIGVHFEILRRAGRSAWPLFRSHFAFLFFQSFAYLSCSLAWRFILYRKSSPEGFEEKIFSFCSVLELFNLLFVRSVHSAALYPKLAVAIMVYLHFYVFASLYPFHTLALAAAACSAMLVMVYCLNHFEEPALRSDPFSHTTPSTAHPRALYMPQLSPSWSVESAPLWTMFYAPEPPSGFPPEAMRNISNEEYLMP